MTTRFLVAEGFASLRRVAVASSVGALLTGIALAILGGLLLLAMIYRADLDEARASVGAEVFLADWVNDEGAQRIARQLASFPEVENARPRATKETLEMLGLKGSPLIPLPRTIRVDLSDEVREAEATGPATMRISDRARKIPGVDEIAFPDQLVRTVDRRSALFFEVAIVVVGALALSVIGIVGNTAHTTVLARRPVITTMRLLGAERRWIIAPFLIQGSMIGFAGGLLAAVVLFLLRYPFPGLETSFGQGEYELFLLVFPAVGTLLAGFGALCASFYYLRSIQ